MSRFAVVLAAALLAVAACFIKPDAPAGANRDAPTPDDGGNSDGTGSGSIDAAVCVPSDDFSAPGVACGNWGIAATTDPNNTGNPTLDRFDGRLNLNLSGIYTSATCTTLQPFKFAVGTSVEVVAPAAAMPGATTWFAVILPNNSSMVKFSIIRNSNSSFDIELACPAGNMRMLATSVPRWIKFTGISDNPGGIGMVTINVETSIDANAANWVPFDSCVVLGEIVATCKAEMGGQGSATDVARFDNFNIKTCPPP